MCGSRITSSKWRVEWESQDGREARAVLQELNAGAAPSLDKRDAKYAGKKNQMTRVKELLEDLQTQDRLFTIPELESMFSGINALGALESARRAKAIVLEQRSPDGNKYRVKPNAANLLRA